MNLKSFILASIVAESAQWVIWGGLLTHFINYKKIILSSSLATTEFLLMALFGKQKEVPTCSGLGAVSSVQIYGSNLVIYYVGSVAFQFAEIA